MCTKQAVRPEIVLNALNWLKANNELYKTITIDIDRIDRNLTTLEVTSIPERTTSTRTDVEPPMNEEDISTDENISEQINEPKNEEPVINETSKNAQQEEQEEEIDDPLNEHRAPTNETCIKAIIPDYPVTIDQQNISTGQEIYSVAPGENKHPVSLMKDKTCKELAGFKPGRRKYKNIKCRFNFGQFFTNRTIIAEPLPDDLGDELKQPILKKQKEILTSVKEKINTVLNPSKSEDYDPNLTETDIFSSLGITEEEYYNALSISPDSDYDLHLKLLYINSLDHIQQLTAVTTLILESCKMSSPLNKTSSKRKNEETLIGYAQDVSEVKRNRKNTMDYVTMRIQTSPVKTCQALLYSPQKCKIFVHSKQTKMPIKIKDFAKNKQQ